MRSLLSGKPKRLQPQRWFRGYFINQVVVNTQLRPGISPDPAVPGRPDPQRLFPASRQ